MTCGNPIKHKLQKVVDNWLDMFSVEKKVSDDQMETTTSQPLDNSMPASKKVTLGVSLKIVVG